MNYFYTPLLCLFLTWYLMTVHFGVFLLSAQCTCGISGSHNSDVVTVSQVSLERNMAFVIMFECKSDWKFTSQCYMKKIWYVT